MFDATANEPPDWCSAEDIQRWWSQRSDDGDEYTEPALYAPHPLDEIARYERAQASFLGGQLEAIARHIAAVRASAPPWVFDSEVFASAAAEICLRMGVDPAAGDRRVGEAMALSGRLPDVLAALSDGRLTHRKIIVFLDETQNISDRDILRRVQDEILPIAPSLAPPRLRVKLRRLIEKLDADALAKRAEKARKDRRVELRREADGMASVNAFLPIEQALAIFGVIDTFAHAVRTTPGEDRTIDQLRADAFVDLICHPADQPSRVRYETHVLVPADLLLDRDGAEPARMADGSAIPNDLARAIAADTRWRLLLTDPGTGHLLDLGADTYEPSAAMKRLIRARDRRCRFPGCGRPAHRSELDHTIKFPIGRTIRTNLAALCKHHHRIKHLPGWQCAQDPDTAALTFTTPRGGRYTTRPPAADGEDHPVEGKLRESMDNVPPF